MSRSVYLPLVGILCLSVFLRVSAAVYLGNEVEALPGTFDQISYDALARRVGDGSGFTFDRSWWPQTAAEAPTAHWSYLYTLFLAGVYAIAGPNPLVARILQAVIVGTLHPFLAFWIARRIFGVAVGLVAALGTAIYVYFVYYAAVLMTEAFYIPAILASLAIALAISDRTQKTDRRVLSQTVLPGVLLGLSIGIAVLLRQVYLLFVPFLFLWVGRKANWRPVWIAAATLALMILPITIFNYARFDRFVLLNTNAGFAFFWANHPIYGLVFQPILNPELGTSYAQLIPAELRGLDEAALDRALLQRGIRFVIDDPLRYVLLSLSRIPAYFKFWPSTESGLISNISRVASFALFLPFMVIGLWLTYGDRAFRSEHPRIWMANLLALFTLLYTAIHLLSWALIRYRLPVDSILMIFAGAALVELVHRLIRWRQPALSMGEPQV